MAIVLSLTAKQHEWLQSQLSSTESSTGVEIYAKLIKPVKAKQSSALLDAIVDSSISPAAEPGGDSSGGGAVLAEDGNIKAPEPEWDDTSTGTGSEVLQPGTPGVDLGLDNNQHPDGFSGDTPASSEFTD